jgi:hypothetical protein
MFSKLFKKDVETKSLRTIDNIQSFSLLPNPENVQTKIIESNNTFILQNFLTPKECNTIISNSDIHLKACTTYLKGIRDSSRICVLDPNISKVIWNRIKPHIICHFQNKTPMGFLTAGIWSPYNINECIRINKYTAPTIGFTPHYDAAYCKSFNEKSIYTILIYLNHDFIGGDTIIYDKPNKIIIKNSTVEEELYINGGIKTYNKMVIKPEMGKCFMFEHNMLHSGNPLIFGNKYILKADFVFKCEQHLNMNINMNEYNLAASNLMNAQKLELNSLFEKANEYYDKSLNIRINTNKKYDFFALKDIWSVILKYVDNLDAIALKQTNRIFQLYCKQFIKDTVYDKNFLKNIKHLNDNNMTCYTFEGGTNKFFHTKVAHEKNELGCIRLSAILFLINYETNKLSKYYIAQYIPETQRVLSVPKNYLLYCAYNGIPCYGQFYLLSNFVELPTNMSNMTHLIKKKTYNSDSDDSDNYDDSDDYDDYDDSDNSDDFDNENILLSSLFKNNIMIDRQNSGLATEKTVISYKYNVNKYIENKICNTSTHFEQDTLECNTHSLIFDFSNNLMNITKIKTCTNMNICYKVYFPKKPFNHASCGCEGKEEIADIDIISKNKKVITLNEMHICVRNPDHIIDCYIHNVKCNMISVM